MTLPPIIQKRLETQGFVCSQEQEFIAIVPWLRFTYALCAILTGIGTWLASPPLLFTLAIIALIGAIFPVHPFDLLYNYGIRFLTGTKPLPKNGTPKRFACGMGAIWLAVTALLFQSGATPWGYALGGLFTAVAGMAALTYFCMPSTMYGMLFRRR